ncbi:calcium-binding protein [Planotetraspora silvatica]|nr:calcium-binding protein [Planotetraspora silvatica]
MPSPLVSRRVTRTASALTLALATGLSVPIVLATTASAATPSATAAVNGALFYKAASGQANKVTITESLTSDHTAITYVIDDVVPIQAKTGCAHPAATDHTRVSCKVALPGAPNRYDTLRMDLADGNDIVALNNTTGQSYYFNTIYLGIGKDRLTDTGKVDGNFVLGQAGDDTITVGEDATVSAGDGNDTVYASGYVIVDGGKGNDVVRGGTGRQVLSGGDGNDRIYGGTGSDVLYGGKGNDVLYGNSGDDELHGNSGNDKLYGGPGKDRFSGGTGRDAIHQS